MNKVLKNNSLAAAAADMATAGSAVAGESQTDVINSLVSNQFTVYRGKIPRPPWSILESTCPPLPDAIPYAPMRVRASIQPAANVDDGGDGGDAIMPGKQRAHAAPEASSPPKPRKQRRVEFADLGPQSLQFPLPPDPVVVLSTPPAEYDVTFESNSKVPVIDTASWRIPNFSPKPMQVVSLINKIFDEKKCESMSIEVW